MSTRTTIWVHGLEVKPEFPAEILEFDRLNELPFVSRSEQGIGYVPPIAHPVSTFYVVIPAPGLLDDLVMEVRSVFVNFSATGTVIDNIRVTASATQSFNNLGWTGDHMSFDGSNALQIPPGVEVGHGLAIFFDVIFDPAAIYDPRTTSVFFANVGVLLQSGPNWLERTLSTLVKI